jgi:hypothetical protein
VVGTLTGAELQDERFVRKVTDGSSDHLAIHLVELGWPPREGLPGEIRPRLGK